MADFSQVGSRLAHPLSYDNGAFGTAVAVDSTATSMVVGVTDWSVATQQYGGFYTFDWNGTGWTQRGALKADTAAVSQGFFGKAVSLSADGNVLAVGAEQWSGAPIAGQGAVYIFDRSGSTWVQRGSRITDPSAVSYGVFGYSVCLSPDGNTLAVGAENWVGASPNGRGGIIFYDWSGSAWVIRPSRLLDSAAVTFGGFGRALSFNSDATILAVSTVAWSGEALTSPGGVYIFDWSGSAWVKRGSVIKDPAAKSLGIFGNGIALSGSGTSLAIGARDWSGASPARKGSVLVYDWSGSAWVLRQTRIVDSAAIADGEFGAALSMGATGERLAISAVHWSGASPINQGAVYTYESSLKPLIKDIDLAGQTPAFSTFSDVAVRGSVTIAGQTPAQVTPFNPTAVSGSIALVGQAPEVALMVDLLAEQLSISLTGETPPDPIRVIGRGFHAELNPSTFSVAGRGFSVAPQIVYSVDYPNTVTGRGFSVTPEILGGSVVTGRGFSAVLESDSTPNNEFSVVGRGFTAELTFSFTPSSAIRVSGRGFSAVPEIFGGGLIIGRGFSASLESDSVTSNASISVEGRGFSATLEAYAQAPTTISVTGRGFSASLYRAEVSGRGFAVTPVIQFASASVNTEAFVLNILTQQVSRYTNYPFMHIAAIGGKYYGVKGDGLYLLEGDLDIDAEINGTIVTKDTDFGEFQSKNVPFVYLNGDDDYTVTPIVDGVDQPSRQSQFSGRKVKLARGSKGRYWTFKVEGIKHLQGMEYLPDLLQRRVK